MPEVDVELYNGTHACSDIDANITEVQNARTGADSTSYQTLKARLDGENNALSTAQAGLSASFGLVTEKTRNQFNVSGVTIGMNASGNTGFTTRALSQAFHRTGTALTISVKTLPANLKYQLEGYTDANFGGVTSLSSDWITTADKVTTTSAKEYIRILFGSVDNKALTAADFSGLEMQVEDGSSATMYVPDFTAIDFDARNGIASAENFVESRIANISETTQNKFSPDCITIGVNQAGQSNSMRATSASFHKTGAAQTVSVKTLPANLKYMVIGYTDADYGGAVAISSDWVTSTETITTVSAKDYIRVTFCSVNGQALTSSDFNGLEMQIEDGAAATPYIPPVTAVDHVARSVQQAAGSAPAHVKVMTYNIGAYTYGAGGTIDESVVVPQCRQFFSDEDCDIIGLQENKTTLNTHTSDEAIYDYLYPYKINATNLTAIKSRFQLTDTGSGAFEASSRSYVYGTAYINGKEVFLICVHLSPASAEIRTQEFGELFEILEDHDTFIAFGDFNAGTSEAQGRFDAVVAEGYHTANGGYLGLINTYGDHTEYLDNIFTSGDITIAKTYVPDVYASMPSDHLPFVCDLIIYP